MRSLSTAAAGLVLILALVAPRLGAQDPASSYDHPGGNINETTLAGLQPGRTRLAGALAKYGSHWRHPSADETDFYAWCDARSRLALNLEAPRAAGTTGPDTRRVIQVVTVYRLQAAPAAGDCGAVLPAAAARTGRGVRLGDTAARLRAVYGKPFFQGPSSWLGHDVQMIVFNFAWAGAELPQILETSFDRAGRLVKMTLSAQYY